MHRYGLLGLMLLLGLVLVQAQSHTLLNFSNSRTLLIYGDEDNPAQIHWIQILQKKDTQGHNRAIYVVADTSDPWRKTDLLSCSITYDNALMPQRLQNPDTVPLANAPQRIEMIQNDASELLTILGNASCGARSTVTVGGVVYEQCPLLPFDIDVNHLPGTSTLSSGQTLFYPQGNGAGYADVKFDSPARESVRFDFTPNPQWVPFACMPHEGLKFPAEAGNILATSAMQFSFETTQSQDQIRAFFSDQLPGWTISPMENQVGFRFSMALPADDDYTCELALTFDGGKVYGDGAMKRTIPTGSSTIPFGPVYETRSQTTVAAQMDLILNNTSDSLEVLPEFTLQNAQRGFLATINTITGVEEYHSFYQIDASNVRYLLDRRMPYCSFE